jgi:hypothetical protein
VLSYLAVTVTEQIQKLQRRERDARSAGTSIGRTTPPSTYQLQQPAPAAVPAHQQRDQGQSQAPAVRGSGGALVEREGGGEVRGPAEDAHEEVKELVPADDAAEEREAAREDGASAVEGGQAGGSARTQPHQGAAAEALLLPAAQNDTGEGDDNTIIILSESSTDSQPTENPPAPRTDPQRTLPPVSPQATDEEGRARTAHSTQQQHTAHQQTADSLTGNASRMSLPCGSHAHPSPTRLHSLLYAPRPTRCACVPVDPLSSSQPVTSTGEQSKAKKDKKQPAGTNRGRKTGRGKGGNP